MYIYICLYLCIYICMHVFFHWICVFAYAGEMERWAKFRCKRSAFQIAWIISTDLWFTCYWNWTCDYLLCPSAAPPGHWSLVSWLAFLRIPEPISVQHLQDGVAILMARLLQRSFSNSEPWSFYSGYHFWPSLFWQWVTPGYPVGCFRCRQLFVASDGARGWRPCIVPRLTEKGAEKGK